MLRTPMGPMYILYYYVMYRYVRSAQSFADIWAPPTATPLFSTLSSTSLASHSVPDALQAKAYAGRLADLS